MKYTMVLLVMAISCHSERIMTGTDNRAALYSIFSDIGRDTIVLPDGKHARTITVYTISTGHLFDTVKVVGTWDTPPCDHIWVEEYRKPEPVSINPIGVVCINCDYGVPVVCVKCYKRETREPPQIQLRDAWIETLPQGRIQVQH